jgi:hypothetical protein
MRISSFHIKQRDFERNSLPRSYKEIGFLYTACKLPINGNFKGCVVRRMVSKIRILKRAKE